MSDDDLPTTQRLMRDLSYLEGAQAALDGGSSCSQANCQDVLTMGLRGVRLALRLVAAAPADARELPEPNPEWEAKAAAFHAEGVAQWGAEPAQTALMLRSWSKYAGPANDLGQVSFARAMLDNAETAIATLLRERDRAQAALRNLQEGAALALATLGDDPTGPVADFLAAIHREAVKGQEDPPPF